MLPRLFEMQQSKDHWIESGLVTDTQAVEATLKFANHHRMLVEPACGAVRKASLIFTLTFFAVHKMSSYLVNSFGYFAGFGSSLLQRCFYKPSELPGQRKIKTDRF